MARFTNYATLSYTGGSTESNTVTGEVLETLTAAKTAVAQSYAPGERIAYAVSLVNSGAAPLTGLSVSDDLGGYLFGEATVYPLAYAEGSLRYYVNGVLQTAPAVTAGPPMLITGVDVPAGGNAILVYEARVTDYAPPDAEGTVTNTVTVTGAGIAAPVTATETVAAESRLDLRILKALSPAAVTENGRLTYTFTVENSGSLAAVAADSIVLTDTFNPVLRNISVTYNGAAWTEGVNYTYDETTGVFTTVAGQITIPAAAYTQNAQGVWSSAPGTAVITVSGTV